MRGKLIGHTMSVLRNGKPRWVQERRRATLAIGDVCVVCQLSRKKDTKGDQQSISWFLLFFCTIAPFHNAITTSACPLEDLMGEKCEAYDLELR